MVKQSLEKNLPENAVFFATQLETLTNLKRDKQKLAEAYFASHQFQRAVHWLEKERLIEERLDSLYLAARCKASLLEWEPCLNLLEQSLQSVMQSDFDREDEEEDEESQDSQLQRLYLLSAISLLRGNAYTALENRPKALHWYKQSLMTNLYSYEAFEALTKGHMMTIAEGKELLNALPFSEDSMWLKNLYSSKLKKYVDVDEDQQSELFTNQAINVEVECARAERLFYQNQFQKAHKLADSILVSDPYIKGNILVVYISCLVELKLKSVLFNFSHKLVGLYPNSAIAWYGVGCYYYLIKNYADARFYFSKSTIADKDFGAPWLAFGHAFASQGEHDQALAAYRSANRLLIGSHLPPLCIGMELVRGNDLSLAIQFITQAKDICPYDPLVFNELGVIEFKSNNFQNAIQYFEEALQLLKGCEGDGEAVWVPWEATVVNLAHCHRKLGNYQEAFKHYQHANQLRPGASLTALGFCQHMMGDTELAIEYYHKALGLDPDDTIAETMLKKALQELAMMPCSFLRDAHMSQTETHGIL